MYISVGNTIGSAIVACVDNTSTPNTNSSCTISGLTNGVTYYFKIFIKDSAGNYSSGFVPKGSPFIPSNITFTQSDYRFFASSTNYTPGTALASQNISATTTEPAQVFRLRMLFGYTGGVTQENGRILKLQYALKSGTCDASFVGETYSDITNSTPISFYRIPTLLDNNLLDQPDDLIHGTSTVVNQTYEDFNNFTNSQSPILGGEYSKWEFSLRDNNATSGSSYCIRTVNSNGTLLNSYANIPQINIPARGITINSYRIRKDDYGEADATNIGGENTPLTNGFYVGDKLRIRFTISNTGGIRELNNAFSLEYANGSCTSWTTVPKQSTFTNQHWMLSPTSLISDNVNTNHLAVMSVPNGMSFVPGKLVTNDIQTAPITLNTNQFTEVEYAIRSTQFMTPNTKYCFRITNGGSINNMINNAMPEITFKPTYLRPQAGGSGGLYINFTPINQQEIVFTPQATSTITSTTTQSSGTATTTVETTSTTTVQTSTTTPKKKAGGGGDSGFLEWRNGYAVAHNTKGLVLGVNATTVCLRITNILSYNSDDSTTQGEVSDLQYYLQQKGYFNSPITGYFKEITEEAVKYYQKDNNLRITGTIYKDTAEKIQESCFLK